MKVQSSKLKVERIGRLVLLLSLSFELSVSI
jgi:hypothetical protein